MAVTGVVKAKAGALLCERLDAPESRAELLHRLSSTVLSCLLLPRLAEVPG